MKPLTVACIKWGDKYSDDYVIRLKNMVERHLDEPHSFVCHTEKPVDGVECKGLLNDHPGWWQKIGLFGRPGRTLYFDLDVVIVGDLRPLAHYPAKLGMIKDCWLNSGNSSVMIIEDQPAIPDDRLEHYPADQELITAELDPILWPYEWCVSYKAHCGNGLPDQARVVYFHGKPDPHEARDDWIVKHWQ